MQQAVGLLSIAHCGRAKEVWLVDWPRARSHTATGSCSSTHWLSATDSMVTSCTVLYCCAPQGLYKQMVDIMKGLDVDAVDTVGSPFDPELHEAIMREPNDEVPDGTVIMEFRKGFRMGERLLRPAMVKVSFSEAAAEVSSADTDSEPNSIDETSS